MPEQMLDYDKNITLDMDNPPIANLHALRSLPYGMFVLANEMRKDEIEKNAEGLAFSVDFMDPKPSIMFWNYYQRFTMNITNYLRIVALVDILNKNNRKSADIIQD
jgi:hypothetical protein